MFLKAVDLWKDWRKEEVGEEVPGTGKGIRLSFPAKEGAKVRPYGFDVKNEAAFDAMRWYGLKLGLTTSEPCREVSVTAGFYGGGQLTKKLYFAETGEHECDLRLEDFPVETTKSNIWRDLVFLQVTGAASLQKALLVRGNGLAVETGVLGKAGEIGETVSYTVVVHNCTPQPMYVSAVQQFEGWESLLADICPDRFLLEAYGEQKVDISVKVHDYLPVGAHEKTQVRFVPEGDSLRGAFVTVITLRSLTHPYIYHTEEKWREVRAQIDEHPVFRPGYEELKKDADEWKVPAIVPFGERDYCYNTREEHYIMSCAYLYALTKELVYAEKIQRFFRDFMDEETGYPARKKGCSQSYVQEGHFFQHLALAYDITYHASVWTKEDRQGIERCFRIYMEILDRHICNGHISNWVLSELTGAVYCAMVLQDFERMERFLKGPGGSFDQLCHGAFSDGWWHECSIGYNIWVSSMFLHTAHALLPFGINILHKQFPLSYGKEVDSTYACRSMEIRHGMYNEKWGGIQKPSICIKDLFDAVIPFLDYRGVMMGVNDSAEKKIEGVHFGSTFDLAYTHYQDPAYIPIIRRFDKADPIFGHAKLLEGASASEGTSLPGGEASLEKSAGKENLPKPIPGSGMENAYADNFGVMVLRSHAKGRADREQIQAALRYGSHGFAHGHFDRTELLSLMRYGRSFYNPESIWWGYGHFMYKFYVQNSNTKNMVVVDGKLQVPADAKRILFYTGKSFQAGAVRTRSRWGYPPYGGMIYDGRETLKERCEMNVCDLPLLDEVLDQGQTGEAKPRAGYGEISDLTEPVRQTRVLVVLDDCIVLFDCLEGETEHFYESLLEIKGFRELKPVFGEGSVKYVRHTGKKSENPLADTQFITDCHWYKAEGETVASFEMQFGSGTDQKGNRTEYNEPGNLDLDVYTAWPPVTEQMHGLEAEDLGIKVPYDLRVLTGEECILEYSANAWLLGARKLDVKVNPEATSLTMEIFNKPLYSEQKYPYRGPQGLFLAGACVELENGECVSLGELPLQKRNIDEGCGIGKDYQGGRVLIEGQEYADAIPVSPVDHEEKACLTIDLSGLQEAGHRAVCFHGILGADNFPGDETARRRHYAVGQHAVEGRFVTVIEPHEGTRRVETVKGCSQDKVRVNYCDGSWQEISVKEIQGEPVVTVEGCMGGQMEKECSSR